MSRRTVAAAAAVLCLLVGGGAVGYVLLADGGGPVPGAATGSVDGAGGTAPAPSAGAGDLRVRWVSNTTSDVRGNHHAAAAGRVGGEPVVYVPIGGRRGEDGCALVALDGDGEQRWRHDVPPEDCTIHAVADPTLADVDGDGTREVLATTTGRTVYAFAPLSGRVEFAENLTAYGYTHPVLGDVTGDGTPELVVSDVDGTLFAFRRNGTTVWQRRLGGYSWAHPATGDFDGDGRAEVVVGLGDGRVVQVSHAGRVEWNRTGVGSVTWMTSSLGHGHGGGTTAVTAAATAGTPSGHRHGWGRGQVVVATAGGDVVALDGGTGEPAWRRSFGAFAAVGAYADLDGDGSPEVYATARDGQLRRLNASTGSTVWTTTLTTGDVQMTPPPVAGDVDGDGDRELVATTNDGRVLVVAPDGSVLATYRRDAAVYTHATLVDADGDGSREVYATYGDGKVVALAYER